MTNRLLPLMAGLALLSFSAFGQRPGQFPTLNLLSGAFEIPLDEDQQLTQSDLQSWPEVDGRKYGVVSFETYPTKEEQEELRQLGINLLEYIPTGFYSVSIAQGAPLESTSRFGLITSAPMRAEFKMITQADRVPARAMRNRDDVALSIRTFADIELTKLATDLSSVEEVTISLQEPTFGYVEVELPLASLEELAELPSVATIEWIYPEGEPENYTSRTLARTRYLSHDNSNGIGYDGSGVSVGIQDNGAIGPHIDYHGRIEAQFTTLDEGDHGDHVTGTVAGSGNLNPWHQGQAEGASIYVYKAYPEYNGISSLDSHYTDYNIYLTSTSYSDGCNAGYTSRTRTVDLQSYQMDRLIHVYSAGNSGTSNCNYGAGSFWGNITGGHKMGKNVVTVGNLSRTDVLSGSSSRGPAHDGRIKPDICAQGTSVTSTIAGNQYDTYTGTSMSCPSVAGSLALLYEAFEDQVGTPPDGGLMKSIVLNTAEDLGNVGPDFKHGWGRINARRAFSVISDGTFMRDSISSGASANTHQITVPSGALRLRVMVYWTDPQAAVGASTALVNDLDLLGLSPASDSLWPYVLDPTPNAVTLDDPATLGVDHLNNMEQIEVMMPEAGTYSFHVSPYSVPVGPQEYFLVYYIEEEPLVLTYPIGGESLTPNTDELIRWDTELSGNLAIDYSIDGGTSWSSVVNSVPTSQGQYEWDVPVVDDGDVRVRLVHDSATVSSEDLSIMTTPDNIQVMFACPDSIGLMWDPIAPALSYDVYKLGNVYMDSIGTSTTEMFVDYWSNPYSDMLWYSVSSDGPSGAKSKRAISVKKSPGLQNCFLGNDLNAVTVMPNISQVFACYGTEIDLGFVVENTGVTPSSAFEATFIGPNGVIISDSFQTSIAPLDFDTFYFSAPVALDSGLQVYDLIIDMAGDQNHYNDTAVKAFSFNSSDAIDPLWEEHFDQMNFICSDQSNCGATTCELPSGWINVANGLSDDVDWRVYEGATPSSFTGPFGDNTTPGGQGKYVYIEASGDCVGQEGYLVSPCIDLTNSVKPRLTFYYSMYGSQMGELHVDVFDGTNWHLDVMDPVSGNQGSSWRDAQVGLSAFVGNNINVRFRGITGGDYRSDIALDDIAITHPPVANFEYFTQANGQTVLFNDLSVYADSMLFDLGDGTLPTDYVPTSHDYLVQNTYTVKQVVTNNYGIDSLLLTIVNLGLGQQSIGELTVYPNPASNSLTVESTGKLLVEEVSLWTVDGRLIVSSQTQGSTLYSLDISEVSPGAYVLRVNGEEGTHHPIMIVR